MIPAGQAPDVDRVAAALDGDFAEAYGSISSSRSGVTCEAVQQLKKLSTLPELELRSTLILFATEREAIPAASYADRLVKSIACEPAPFGRIFSFALHNAWVDEALHTQFLVACVPDDSYAKRKGERARRRGHVAGAWSARVFHGPGPLTRLAHKGIVQFAAARKDAPRVAIYAVKPLTTAQYFSTAVDFEYAAALGWRVIAAADLPKREIPAGTGELHRVAWRMLRHEPGDLGRVAEKIACAEIRHTKVLSLMATADALGVAALIASLNTIHDAFVAPEFRLPPGSSSTATVRKATTPGEGDVTKMLSTAAKGKRISGVGSVILAIGDCSTSTARAISTWFRDTDDWHHQTIGAPSGFGLTPADLTDRWAFELEAGCARAVWPNAWVSADIRVTISDVGRRRQPDLSLGALGRLVQVLPEELGRPFRGMPDPHIHALMWLLEQYPPDISIVLGADGSVFYDDDKRPVTFDESVVRDERLRRSAWLEEAVRWFGPLS